MGRQEKKYDRIVYQQRPINTDEVEIHNSYYKSDQSNRTKYRNLIKAYIPQLVRDLNTHMGIIAKENKSRILTVEQQLDRIVTAFGASSIVIVDEHLGEISSLIEYTKPSITVEKASTIKVKGKPLNQITINYSLLIKLVKLEEPQEIILSWVVELDEEKTPVLN